LKDFSPDGLRETARNLFWEAVSAVDPSKGLERILRADQNILSVKTGEDSEKSYDLHAYKNIFLIGSGKASAPMAQSIEGLLGDRISRGVITTKYGHALPLRLTEVIESGHPLPDLNGLKGARKIKDLLQATGAEDLVIFVLSGGGSALLPLPVDGIELAEKQEATQLLLDCGAEIREINTVRKHISQIKGGWLARWAHPSRVIAFLLSDVVGDPLDAIGSGPTAPDPTTFADAWEILRKYDLTRKIAPSIRRHLQSGREGKVPETPKPGDPVFEKVENILIGSNILALRAASRKARTLGFNTLILSSSIVGETREAAKFHAAIAKEIVATGHPLLRPACILSGGETTVTIRGRGRGGRNQEFALAAALEIDGLKEVVLLSGGTDGTDGPTDAAGAVVDHTTVKRATAMGMHPKTHLEENNAYPFFQKLGDLLMTGPTRTNVMDVRILLVV
jgi:hydroxypyruvate reductase